MLFGTANAESRFGRLGSLFCARRGVAAVKRAGREVRLLARWVNSTWRSMTTSSPHWRSPRILIKSSTPTPYRFQPPTRRRLHYWRSGTCQRRPRWGSGELGGWHSVYWYSPWRRPVHHLRASRDRLVAGVIPGRCCPPTFDMARRADAGRRRSVRTFGASGITAGPRATVAAPRRGRCQWRDRRSSVMLSPPAPRRSACSTRSGSGLFGGGQPSSPPSRRSRHVARGHPWRRLTRSS